MSGHQARATGLGELARQLTLDQLALLAEFDGDPAAATPRSPIAGASGPDLTAVVLDHLSAAVVTARHRAGHD
jgi:hypothetical protein